MKSIQIVLARFVPCALYDASYIRLLGVRLQMLADNHLPGQEGYAELSMTSTNQIGQRSAEEERALASIVLRVFPPYLSSAPIGRICWTCQEESSSKCSGCYVARYCSKACAQRGWQSGRKDICSSLRSLFAPGGRQFLRGLCGSSPSTYEQAILRGKQR